MAKSGALLVAALLAGALVLGCGDGRAVGPFDAGVVDAPAGDGETPTGDAAAAADATPAADAPACVPDACGVCGGDNPHCLIGDTTLTLTGSPGTSGDLTVRVFYPAYATGTDAAPSPGAFPLAVFGHGYQQSYQDYRYAWENLVPRGFIVALHDRLSSDLTIDIDEYALDLGFIVARVRALGAEPTSPLFGHVAAGAAILGHSTGGGASFNAAADAAAGQGPLPTTIVALAPLGNLTGSPIYGTSPITAAAAVTVPTLILGGGEDCLCPVPAHGQLLYDALPAGTTRYRATLTRGDHCGFSDRDGPGLAKCEAGEAAMCFYAQGPTMTVAEQNQLAMTLVAPWLEHYLQQRPAAWGALQAALGS
ncbi:MAG TPA: hypothetical protein VGQ83_20520, partial [Polyangia bacterium]